MRKQAKLASERGDVIILATVMVVVLMAFAALTVDIGMALTADSELQNAMDAAALAGAARLLDCDYDGARDLAVQYAGLNTVLGQPLVLDPQTGVTLGVFDMQAQTFTPVDQLAPGISPNSMRISATVNVPFFFAPVMGFASTTLGQQSTSVASQAIRFVMLVLDKSGSMGNDSAQFYTTTSGVDIEAGTYGLKTPGSDCYWYHSVVGFITIPYGSQFYRNGYYGGAYVQLPAGRLYYGRWVGHWEVLSKDVYGLAQPMTDAQDAAEHFVNQLDFTNDKCGLVTYSTSASTDLVLSQNQSSIISAVQGFVPERSTNVGQGLEHAVTEFQSPRAQGFCRKVIILLSDGLANVGGRGMGGTDYALWAAEQARQEGIMVYTISLGNGADDAMMQQIANTTGADWYKATHGGELPVIFEEIAHSVPPQLTM